MTAPVLQNIDRTYVLWEGKKYHFFGGFDYHRLSCHPDVLRALNESALELGISSGGSRSTTGTHPVHRLLEKKLARFFGMESAILLPTGYLANIALLQIIQKHENVYFIDKKAHPSLNDAVQLNSNNIFYFSHHDLIRLKMLIEENLQINTSPLIITEGMDALGGSLVPLNEYEKMVERHEGTVIIDDAHAVGVLGKTGKGSWEEAGISPQNIIQTGTLSKAFGVYGGFVLGNKDLISEIKNGSPAYMGSSALPLPLCAAAIQAINILSENPSLITGLQKRSLEFKSRLQNIGRDIPLTPTPVFAIIFNAEKKIRFFKKVLLANNIYPSFIQYPGGPAEGYFRFSLSSAHSDDQIEILYNSIMEALG